MNKRLEDKLAMLAFEDLTPEETRLLEQEIAGNAEATGILDDYRLMRGGLKKMADIPEHQLSTERLRHAILNQGLKPKPARRQIGWLWMPGMAMVLAFSIVVVRNMNSSTFPSVGNPVADSRLSNDSALPDSVVDTPRIENAFAFATASGEIMSVAKEPGPATSRVSHRRTHRRSVSEDFDKLDELKDAIKKEFENMASTPPPTMKAVTDIETKPAAKRTAMAASEESPIVLIDSTKDKTTGAQRATEVDSASNVLVGG